MNVLTGIYQYLIDRYVSADLFSGYIVVHRNTTNIDIRIEDTQIAVKVSRRTFVNDHTKAKSTSWTETNFAKFDLVDPNSLQSIYEFVMAIVNK